MLLQGARGRLHCLKENEMLEGALEVWNQLPNYKIEICYVLSHRIAKKVIKNNGDNIFLGEEKGIRM